MFERYTESARRALFFARYETSELGGLTIESEHLLLGLLRDSKGLTSALFKFWGVSYDDVRGQLGPPAGDRVATSVEIPFSADTTRILRLASEEADKLQHAYIGTEHLVLGILREGGSRAASILGAKGLTLDAVREDIVRSLAGGATSPRRTQAGGDEGDLVDRLNAVIELVTRVRQLGEAEVSGPEGASLLFLILQELTAIRDELR